MAQFTWKHRVQFAETDTAGIVHFSNYYRFMEETEREFFRTLGLSIMAPQPDGTVIGWPRVRASCSFESPAHYDDLLEIDVDITRRGVKSLSMSFHFRRGETTVARGDLKTVCCRSVTLGKLESIEIPEEWAAKLIEKSS
jgi:YbgC/YbaW family acyl-CoA thioester hydrolase